MVRCGGLGDVKKKQMKTPTKNQTLLKFARNSREGRGGGGWRGGGVQGGGGGVRRGGVAEGAARSELYTVVFVGSVRCG